MWNIQTMALLKHHINILLSYLLLYQLGQ